MYHLTLPAFCSDSLNTMTTQAEYTTLGFAVTSPTMSDVMNIFSDISKLYVDDDVARNVMRIGLRAPPLDGYFPHHADAESQKYKYEPSEWWTSGFFPGSLWLLYQRSLVQPQPFPSEEILRLARQWQKGMEKEQFNTATHDLGFMIMPAFYRDYQFTGSTTSRQVIIQAAKSLSSRWNEKVESLRSWDGCVSKRFSYENCESDFLVIIDNMMNLDLLYVASKLTGDPEFARRATAHAWTTLRHHIRPDYSTYHLVNYDPLSGTLKGRYTVQGFSDNSTWARGQAWALYGFATAYRFTGEPAFLEASRRLTAYFCQRVTETSADGAVYWDFDAPSVPELWDTSAAMIASSGMLLLHQLTGDTNFLSTLATILKTCALLARNPLNADTILDHATVNNNQDAHNPVRDTGLVYADYYFLEVGNRLLEIIGHPNIDITASQKKAEA
jgi:hypothetical protein